MPSPGKPGSPTATPSTRIAKSASRRRIIPTRSRDEYLKRANAAIAHNRELLPQRFNNVPQYRMEVVREPAFSEVAGGAAHASGPSPDGTRPGRVYVHLWAKPRIRPRSMT